MCECIDRIVDPTMCHHNAKNNLFRNLKKNLHTLPFVSAAELLDYIRDNKESEIIINLLLYISTSESRDFFYADTWDNIPCEYIILMEYEETIYKLYPNQKLEKIISGKTSYISGNNCNMQISFLDNEEKILKKIIV